jgi:hypothetical protein
MKGFDPTAGHPFGEPFITYHVQRARGGDYDSARWLRDNIRAADKDGRPVDPAIRFLVDKWRTGGLRKAMRLKERGKRGAALGDHRQLLLAREMWKQVDLARVPITKAAADIARRYTYSYSKATAAYYRFTRQSQADRRALCFELSRHIVDCMRGFEEWSPGASQPSPEQVREALRMMATMN